MKYILSLAVCMLAYAVPASAHNFKLDSYGCHNNGALNVYECHDGVMKGKSWPNPGGKTKMLVELNTPPPPPPPPCVPPAPPEPKIGRETNGAVLTWNPVPAMEEPITYEISFYVRDIRDTPLSQQEIDNRSVIAAVGQRTAVFLGSILPDTGYWFRVRAVHKQSYSEWSSSVYYKGNL